MIKEKPQLTVYYRRNDGLRLSVTDLRKDLYVSPKWQLVDYDEQAKQTADLIILGTHAKHYAALCAEVLAMRIKHGYNSFLVALSQESIKCDAFPGADYSISFLPDGEDNLYLGVTNNYMQYLEPLLTGQNHPLMQQNRAAAKDRFCNFIYSNSHAKLYEGVRARMDFCRELQQYKRVDCPGTSLNNTDELKLIEDEQRAAGGKEGHWEAKFKFIRNYKFSIIFENESKEGYITEKLWHAYIAGSIPIYWGAPDVAKYFNPRSMLNCHDYENLSQVIERVKELDNNPQLLRQYREASPIAPDSKFHKLTSAKIAQRMDLVLQQASAQKAKWQQTKYPRSVSALKLSGFILANLHIIPYMLLKYLKNF